jgi:mannose-6-phosphate isomerase-like protein (cupin superfamily)|tara:strand:- start:4456 stop:4920 length:465 start_codon:yes stop_codon:yes gene_type:complete
MNSELSVNFIKKLEVLQNILIESDNEQTFGDGKNLVNNEHFPITNNFSDGLYMRQMKMKAGSVVISAIHHTNHFWFLLSGKVILQADNETVEHIAPCWSYSLKGTKRLIKCVEDCVWINIIANPTDTKNMEDIENNFFSITMEEYNKKEKLWQE